MIEQDPEIMLQKVAEVCQKLINVKRDNTQFKEKNISRVQEIKQPKFTKNNA